MNFIITRNQFLIDALKASIVLSALDAVAIGPVPLSWISIYLVIFASFVGRGNLKMVPKVAYLLIFWAFIVQIFSLLCLSNNWCNSYEMPPLSTTPYPIYIGLRYVPLFMLIAVVASLAKIQNRIDEIEDFLIKAGFWISIVALYVYMAQLNGLPDIPRTRLGTDGNEVTEVAFTYGFHRALSTFREPSGMAVWLMLPFFLSLRTFNYRTFFIFLAILLSGSMSAFVAMAAGTIMSILFILLRPVNEKRWLAKFPLILMTLLGVGVALFSSFVKQQDSYAGLSGLISDRMAPVIAGGIEESNRGYVFEFAADIGVPVIGHGLGNANLLLTKWQNGDAVAGMLSLYLNILMSLGYVGFLLIFTMFAFPLLLNVSMRNAKDVFFYFGAYFSWLVVFVIHSAEFPLMFAICYGLILVVFGNRHSLNTVNT